MSQSSEKGKSHAPERRRCWSRKAVTLGPTREREKCSLLRHQWPPGADDSCLCLWKTTCHFCEPVASERASPQRFPARVLFTMSFEHPRTASSLPASDEKIRVLLV